MIFYVATIKCSEKCARRDWSERVHYISIKHAPQVTRVHCWDIMHEANVIDPSVHNSQYILLKEIKKLVPRALLSYISTWEFLKTVKGCENHEPKASASRHFSRVLKNSRVFIELNNALGAFFISLRTLFRKRFWLKNKRFKQQFLRQC